MAPVHRSRPPVTASKGVTSSFAASAPVASGSGPRPANHSAQSPANATPNAGSQSSNTQSTPLPAQQPSFPLIPPVTLTQSSSQPSNIHAAQNPPSPTCSVPNRSTAVLQNPPVAPASGSPQAASGSPTSTAASPHSAVSAPASSRPVSSGSQTSGAGSQVQPVASSPHAKPNGTAKSHHRSALGPLGKLALRIFYLLWLVPTASLLVLNLRGYVIGPSAWCPFNACKFDIATTPHQTADIALRKFDRDNHNILGVLQLVSKALEIWFVAITVALAYDLTMRLARRQSGIPLFYVTRPNDFTDMAALLDKTLWTLPAKKLASHRAKSRRSTAELYLFLGLTVVLCILCNLIGPAIAVLILPSLQWRIVPKESDGSFIAFSAAEPSNRVSVPFEWGPCEFGDWTHQRYSCTSGIGAIGTDGIFATWGDTFDSSLHALTTGESWGGNSMAYSQNPVPLGIFYDGEISFSANATVASNGFWGLGDGVTASWISPRQNTGNINSDLEYLQREQDPKSGFFNYGAASTAERVYDKSVAAQLIRYGPILGAYTNYWLGEDSFITNTVVDHHRAVRCYDNYWPGWLSVSLISSDDYHPGARYKRCIQVGAGWGPQTKTTSFSVATTNSSTALSNTSTFMSVTVFSSDRTTFWADAELPTGFDAGCLVNDGSQIYNTTPTKNSTHSVVTKVISLSCLPAADPNEGGTADCQCYPGPSYFPSFNYPQETGQSVLCPYTATTVYSTMTPASSSFPMPRPVQTQFQGTPRCDWQAFWDHDIEPPAPGVDIQSHANTIEISLTQGNRTAVLAVDYVAFLTFATYSLDPSSLSNPLQQIVQTLEDGPWSSLPIDPSWTLGTWSVDRGGVLPADATIAIELYDLLSEMFVPDNDGSAEIWMPFTSNFYSDKYLKTWTSAAILPPVLQTLSVLTFNATIDTSGIAVNASSPGPALYHYGRFQTWAYGMSSRTAYLGVTVMLAGMIVVVAQCAISFVGHSPASRTLTEFLAAALAQQPDGEFDHVGNEKDELSAVTFRVVESDAKTGHLQYEKR